MYINFLPVFTFPIRTVLIPKKVTDIINAVTVMLNQGTLLKGNATFPV